MIDDEAERKIALDLLEKEKSKANPNKRNIELLEYRLEVIDLLVATREDTGFSWILELVSDYFDYEKEIYSLNSSSKKDAIIEAEKILNTLKSDHKQVSRARLYKVNLEKQFRL